MLLSIKFEVQRSAIIFNKTFLRCFKAQTSSGSVVKFVCNHIALCLSKCRHLGAFRQILSAKSADLFIGFMNVSIPQCLRVLRISILLVAILHRMM